MSAELLISICILAGTVGGVTAAVAAIIKNERR